MDDKQNSLGAHNITDLVEKEITGIFNTKTSAEEQKKKNTKDLEKILYLVKKIYKFAMILIQK